MRRLYGHQWLGCVAVSFALSGCGGSDVDTAVSETEVAPDAVANSSGSESAAAFERYPQVSLDTTHGRITLELDAEHAPETVRNFLKYVESGHYDGTLFHQIDQGYVMLGGTFTPELAEKPAGRPIRNEAENGLKNVQGTISMARAADQIDSSTCQFFINLADNAELDHHSLTAEDFGYCVFGRVIDGWDVIETIAAVPVKNSESFGNLPTETVMIRSAKRLR
ncbi:MAG: peptidylprolyl isomerase [Planctomycetia bacterium]|nr:peptidylprolyl isomerase [Planctomycetia bacterium]